jgi:hypothetical protein
MRALASIALCLLLSVPTISYELPTQPSKPGFGGAPKLVTEHYQRANGAIVLETDGNFVDPYFALRALLTAQDEGLDITRPALAWINWLLPRQLPDGRFQRYCLEGVETSRACKPADADDALLVLWLQLLYRMAPDEMPATWRASATKAEEQLAWLYDHKLGIYAVSRRNPVGLFMDNVEIYAALNDIAASKQRLGQQEAAQRTQVRAQEMAKSIVGVFWDKKHKRFRVSTQWRRKPDFYPDAVAQIYPLLLGLPTPNDHKTEWSAWKKHYGGVWIERKRDSHPWGLVALTAMQLGDYDTAACWMAKAAPFRYSSNWNVLEEAVYQGLEAKLPPTHTGPPKCELTQAGLDGAVRGN